MKLSDAFLLGSLAVKPLARVRHLGESGCAIGMAEVAVGASVVQCMEDFWPWVKGVAPKTPPCGSWDCQDEHGVPTPNYTRNFVSIIAHMFNQHVMGDRTWTNEMLADYLRSVEPPEPAEQPESQQPTSGSAATPDSSVGSIELLLRQDVDSMVESDRDWSANTRESL